MKKRLGPAERIYPMPVPILVSGSLGEPRGFTASWINAVASAPPTVVVGIRNSRHTLEMILSTGEFSVNIPSPPLVAEVDFFGTASGAKVDKFALTGLTLVAGATISAPVIGECRFALECRVSHTHEVGEYVIVFAEILETRADEEILDEDGNVDIEALDPLVYIPGAREYHRLGGKVADAYQIGRTVLEGRD